MANFSTGDRRRKGKSDMRSTEISMVIRQTMEACIMTHLLPRSQIDIYVQVLQADGGTRSACINAATLALADAGIPMRDLATSCSAGYLNSTPLVDLNYVEDSAGGLDVTVGYLPKLQKITLLQMDSKLHMDTFEDVMQLATKGCMAVAEYIQDLNFRTHSPTASGRVGRIVMAAAAVHLTPVVLELGEKCPAVVDPNSDIKLAARRIVAGKWGCNNGQTCISPDYIITTRDFAPKLYAFNLFSHNAPVLPNGYNEEEMKLVKETRKFWNDKDVRVTATCIRVPVMREHAESVNLQFDSPLDEDRASNNFPTPLEVSNKDDVAVGRIRRDASQNGDYGLDIFVCGDQIRKGAALNAV